MVRSIAAFFGIDTGLRVFDGNPTTSKEENPSTIIPPQSQPIEVNQLTSALQSAIGTLSALVGSNRHKMVSMDNSQLC
jgi:hypothetical protein